VQPIIRYLLRNQAQPAYSILPPEHWAYNGDVERYPYDPAKARRLLDEAGYPATSGVRFRITIKCSSDDATRLMAVVLQQQLREVGIALDIRSFEFATFFSDITKGAYQIHSLRWIGGNQDPDIFEYVFDTASFPPKRANRTFFSNPRVDELIKQGRTKLDQDKRKVIYAEIQRLVAEQLPYINLWYLDNVLIHTKRVHGITVGPAGNYDFLKTAELAN
jgi:peptide/nickel transport system substrate-binding protein